MVYKMIKGLDYLSYKGETERAVQPQRETAEGGSHQSTKITGMGRGKQ